jgi:hypothetical protein
LSISEADDVDKEMSVVQVAVRMSAVIIFALLFIRTPPPPLPSVKSDRRSGSDQQCLWQDFIAFIVPFKSSSAVRLLNFCIKVLPPPILMFTFTVTRLFVSPDCVRG